MVKYLKKLDTKTFIKKAKEIHHLKYDYSLMKDIVLMEDFIKTNYSNFLIDTGLDFGGKTETFSIDLLKPGEGLTTLLENFM